MHKRLNVLIFAPGLKKISFGGHCCFRFFFVIASIENIHFFLFKVSDCHGDRMSVRPSIQRRAPRLIIIIIMIMIIIIIMGCFSTCRSNRAVYRGYRFRSMFKNSTPDLKRYLFEAFLFSLF